MNKPEISTSYKRKVISDRQFDWTARFHNFAPDDEQPIGHGSTENESVADLIYEAVEFIGDSYAWDAVLELALLGWKLSTQNAEASQPLPHTPQNILRVVD